MRTSKKKNTSGNLLIGVGVAVLLLDILTKSIMVGRDIHIARYMSLTYTTNTGAGFSILTGQNLLLIFLTIMIIGVLLYQYPSLKHPLSQYSVALIIGGAAGNLFDRIIHGHVTDFIDFKIWPVFNVADIAICIGIALLAYSIWRKED